MSTRDAKKKFFREESKQLSKGYTCIDYISHDTIKYVIKKLSRLSKKKLSYCLYNSECEDDCWVIKPIE